jgi:hypothetical protein
MSLCDVIIASLPYVETQEPMMAPGLLKGVVHKANLSCRALDLNIEILHKINQYPGDSQTKVRRWFMYEENQSCPDTTAIITTLVEYAGIRIKEHAASWICLSLFCNTAKKFNILLCKWLRKNAPSSKIIIGGNAVFSNEQSQRPYARMLQRARLIDYFVVGDGEEPLYNILTGSVSGANIEDFQILNDLSIQPFGDYDDYNWQLYDRPRIPMYASRGCVRQCTFCDVHKLWKKFKLRNSDQVFEEMLYQINRTGITEFFFRDSLINGSISEFKKLMGLIADYNKSAKTPIKWSSFFIFRPQKQMPEQDWELAAQGGAGNLIIGVESLVDNIRYHMKKKFTNKDIDFGIEMAHKYNVNLVLLLIVGYVNETEADFQASLDWLEEHKQFAGKPIINISVGGTLTVTDLTDLYQNAQDFDIVLGDKIHLWENKKINLDYETRERRKEQFISRAIELGYPIVYDEKPVS